MHKKKIQKNGIVLFIIGIFIGMAAIPLAGGTTTTQKQLQTLTIDPECEPYYFGELGKNGWYISCVLIRFHCDLELVEAIKYSITLDPNSPDWKTLPDILDEITFCDDGAWTLKWQWKNKFTGNWSDGGERGLNIDQTQPTLKINKKVNVILKKMTFTAECTDVSGIARVEFYLDNRLKENLTVEPYEYVYTWEKKPQWHEVTAKVYDNAGHMNNKTTLPKFHPYHTLFIGKLLQQIHLLYQLFLNLHQ